MPYIPKAKREYWDKQLIFDTEDPELTHPGTLNYLITRIIQHFVASRGGEWDDRNLNSIYGALMCCLLELNRRRGTDFSPDYLKDEGIEKVAASYTSYNNYIGDRVQDMLLDGRGFEEIIGDYYSTVAPYEDSKIKENGDVYE
jgi:hypothetical protein